MTTYIVAEREDLHMESTADAETRRVLDNICWQTFLELAEQRRGSVPRMTYEEGVLEMMSPGHRHENIGSLIGRMVEAYSEVHDIEIHSAAATTFKRPDIKRAFEADQSYYIQHAEQIRPKDEIDLDCDPPADLVIEVEITKSAIAKLRLFASMGIPEVWRHNGKTLKMFKLHKGSYRPIDSSESLPGLLAETINEFLARRLEQGETSLIREFRRSIK